MQVTLRSKVNGLTNDLHCTHLKEELSGCGDSTQQFSHGAPLKPRILDLELSQVKDTGALPSQGYQSPQKLFPTISIEGESG